jgi:translation initiation factor 4E
VSTYFKYTFLSYFQELRNDGEEVPEQVDGEEEEESLSPELLIKHPLQNKWALWFFKNDRTKEWTANLKLVTAFDTVEDFWG